MKPLSRRTLLRGAGGVTIALPFLEAMEPRVAHAQAAGFHQFANVLGRGALCDVDRVG